MWVLYLKLQFVGEEHRTPANAFRMIEQILGYQATVIVHAVKTFPQIIALTQLTA